MRLSQEEEKAVELILKGEYEMVGGLEYCNTAGVYYFFDKGNSKIRVVGKPKDILLYNYKSPRGLFPLVDMRLGSHAWLKTPAFEGLLKAAIKRGYTPTIDELFNISNDAEHTQANEILEITALSKDIQRSSEVDDTLAYAEDIENSAAMTCEYITSLTEERDEWAGIAFTLVRYIQYHIDCEESTKEDLQGDLDALTYHHLLNNKENK